MSLYDALNERDANRDHRLMGATVTETPEAPDDALALILDSINVNAVKYAIGWHSDDAVEPPTPVEGDRVYCLRADDGQLIVVTWIRQS